MGWSWRKSKKIGPFRISASRRGIGGSGGTRRLRLSGSSSGRRTLSFNLGHGLRWSRSRKRRR